jgi:2-polyprenyl-3-methyl-5-hydroxy-6-metoxy-1,4-benzoquinol methylase
MSATHCYLCNGSEFTERDGIVRDAPGLKIQECTSCGLVFLQPPDDRGEQFYADSGMHEGDVAIEEWLRETAVDDERRLKTLRTKITNRNVLDVGCGAGGFLNAATLYAKEATGVEPESRLAPHFQELGLLVHSSIGALPTHSYDLITLFHVLEHIPDPRAMLMELSGLLSETGEIIVEVPSSSDALLTIYKSDAFSRFTYWSCHLNLFNQHTLQKLATQAGLRVNFATQLQRYPLSNHLHWLATGEPGGHKTWSLIDSPELDAAYAASLARMGVCDTIFASLSLPQED